MTAWGVSELPNKRGPLQSKDIVWPSPWPASRRIPDRTLPVAGRVRRILVQQTGPLGLLDKPPVPGLRDLPGCQSDHAEAEVEIVATGKGSKSSAAKGKGSAKDGKKGSNKKGKK